MKIACTQSRCTVVCFLNGSFSQWADQEGVAESTHSSGSQHGYLIMSRVFVIVKTGKQGNIFYWHLMVLKKPGMQLTK